MANAGKHYNGSILESEDTFTFDADTNQITTDEDNQVFTLKNDETTRDFVFKAKSGLINFYLNSDSDHSFKVENGEVRGITGDVFMNVKSFEVHASAGAIFEFDCIA